MTDFEIVSQRLWLDDVRRPPSDWWTWAKTVEEAIRILATGTVVEASLDNDLHPFEHDGTEVCEWMEEHEVWPRLVRVHTSNRFASTKMCNLLERNGYRKLAGRPRNFVKRDGASISNKDIVAFSIKYSPRSMERLRRADEGDSPAHES